MGPIWVLYGQKGLHEAHVEPEWDKCPDSAHMGPIRTCLFGNTWVIWEYWEKMCYIHIFYLFYFIYLIFLFFFFCFLFYYYFLYRGI